MFVHFGELVDVKDSVEDFQFQHPDNTKTDQVRKGHNGRIHEMMPVMSRDHVTRECGPKNRKGGAQGGHQPEGQDFTAKV